MKFLAFVLCVLPMLVGVWHPVVDGMLGNTVLQLINGVMSG